ncbi:MAG: hypothetical protein K1X79_04955 [Oligoflexia bacterium]|nr:hypothetical protein [Oligoflexia bacterium]
MKSKLAKLALLALSAVILNTQTVLAEPALKLGMSASEVIALWGRPILSSKSDRGLVLTYHRGSLVFVNDRLSSGTALGEAKVDAVKQSHKNSQREDLRPGAGASLD